MKLILLLLFVSLILVGCSEDTPEVTSFSISKTNLDFDTTMAEDTTKYPVDFSFTLSDEDSDIEKYSILFVYNKYEELFFESTIKHDNDEKLVHTLNIPLDLTAFKALSYPDSCLFYMSVTDEEGNYSYSKDSVKMYITYE